MKLWKKISLLCGLVLVLTAGVCTAVLTTQARNRILNLTYQNAEQKQQALVRCCITMRSRTARRQHARWRSIALPSMPTARLCLCSPVRPSILRSPLTQANI